MAEGISNVSSVDFSIEAPSAGCKKDKKIPECNNSIYSDSSGLNLANLDYRLSLNSCFASTLR